MTPYSLNFFFPPLSDDYNLVGRGHWNWWNRDGRCVAANAVIWRFVLKLLAAWCETVRLSESSNVHHNARSVGVFWFLCAFWSRLKLQMAEGVHARLPKPSLHKSSDRNNWSFAQEESGCMVVHQAIGVCEKRPPPPVACTQLLTSCGNTSTRLEQHCDHKTCRMCSHCGRNGFLPNKKGSCSITQLLSRPKVSKSHCLVSQETFL